MKNKEKLTKEEFEKWVKEYESGHLIETTAQISEMGCDRKVLMQICKAVQELWGRTVALEKLLKNK